MGFKSSFSDDYETIEDNPYRPSIVASDDKEEARSPRMKKRNGKECYMKYKKA